MSERLSRIGPAAYSRVLEDLGGHQTLGRGGMSAEKVVRIIVLRQLTQWSFDELAFH